MSFRDTQEYYTSDRKLQLTDKIKLPHGECIIGLWLNDGFLFQDHIFRLALFFLLSLSLCLTLTHACMHKFTLIRLINTKAHGTYHQENKIHLTKIIKSTSKMLICVRKCWLCQYTMGAMSVWTPEPHLLSEFHWIRKQHVFLSKIANEWVC